MNNIDLVDLTYLLISAQLVGLQKRSTCLEAIYYLRTQCANQLASSATRYIFTSSILSIDRPADCNSTVSYERPTGRAQIAVQVSTNDNEARKAFIAPSLQLTIRGSKPPPAAIQQKETIMHERDGQDNLHLQGR